MRTVSVFFFEFIIVTSLFAQSGGNGRLAYTYPQKVKPVAMDNYLFSTYFYNGKKTYNLRGAVMSSSDPVTTLKINPSGSSFALLEKKMR